MRKIKQDYKYLQPLKSKVISHKNFFAFDVETVTRKNRFLLVSLYGYTEHKELIQKIFYDKEEFVKYLSSFKFFTKKYSWLVSTNLDFDFYSIFMPKYQAEFKPLYRDSKLITAEFRNILFIDSLNYAKISVKEQGKIVNIPKMELPDYIKERRNPIKAELKYIEQYCMNDSIITYTFMNYLQSSFKDLGCKLKYTISSTSMDLYKRKYLDTTILQPFKFVINEMRKGYYGGRTEVFKCGLVKNLYYYDFNSMYPSVMCEEYPNPNFLQLKNNPSIDILKYEGLSLCEIEHENNLDIPFLPFKDKEGKLLFPVGKFKGWYSHNELRYSLELGYKIKLIKSYYYLKNFYPFKSFVENLYPLRIKYKLENNKMEYAIKILLNSLYGKFAQRTETSNIIHCDKFVLKPSIKEYGLIEDTDFIYYKEDLDKIPLFVNPILSIYTTAKARIKLYEKFKQFGFENIYYCDTDSIITSKFIPSSLQLGELKLERYIESAVLVKPKFYLIDSEIKIKGVKEHSQEIFNKILNGEVINEEQFIKFKTAIRSKEEYKKGKLEINEIIEIQKSISIEDNKRIWNKNFNQNEIQISKPLIINNYN